MNPDSARKRAYLGDCAGEPNDPTDPTENAVVHTFSYTFPAQAFAQAVEEMMRQVMLDIQRQNLAYILNAPQHWPTQAQNAQFEQEIDQELQRIVDEMERKRVSQQGWRTSYGGIKWR